ncbi:MAG: RDD family protein [Microthrixaceae bacterium]
MSSTLVTPEAVLLELPTAGVATRAFARLVDLLVQLVFAAVVGSLGAVLIGPAVSPTLFFIALGFTTLLVLPIAMELIWRGSSLGKAMFGLRVVGADGAPEAPRQAVVRGLVALVDLYLSLGAVAIGAAMFSTRTQRAGDMAAGTVVIRARPTGSIRTPIAFHPPAGCEAYVASLDVGLLRDEDFSLIREFLLRTRDLGPQRRGELAMQLATSIQKQIRHQLSGPIDPELWLICVASAYQLRQGGLLSDAAAGLAPLAAVVPSAPAPARRRSSRAAR